MKARYKAEIWRTGNVNVITVPAQYLKDAVVEHDKEYQITIADIEEPTEEASSDEQQS